MMKSPYTLPRSTLLLGCALLSVCALPRMFAQSASPTPPTHERFGTEKTIHNVIQIHIENREGVYLGHIKELGIDLTRGRIVEVFVVSGTVLGLGGRVVAVPPAALLSNEKGDTYRLDMSKERFAAAPAVELADWDELGRTDRVVAAYHYFGQTPYFLETGESADVTAERPKAALGYVQRSSKLLGLPITNFRSEPIGKVASLRLDVPGGYIRSVVVLAPGDFGTRSVLPARSLTFNPARDALLFDDSKMPFADQPRLLLTEAGNGNPAYSKEESYKGPRTQAVLEQGTGYRDRRSTALIKKNIRAERIAGMRVEVGTLNGRVTLRGWAYTEAEKDRAGAIAIAASRLEMVDNQMTFGSTGNDFDLIPEIGAISMNTGK